MGNTMGGKFKGRTFVAGGGKGGNNDECNLWPVFDDDGWICDEDGQIQEIDRFSTFFPSESDGGIVVQKVNAFRHEVKVHRHRMSSTLKCS